MFCQVVDLMLLAWARPRNAHQCGNRSAIW